MGRKIVKTPRGLGNSVKLSEIVGGIDSYNELIDYLDSVNAQEIYRGTCENDPEVEYDCVVYESPEWEDTPDGVEFEVIAIEIERDRTKIQANKIKADARESGEKVFRRKRAAT